MRRLTFVVSLFVAAVAVTGAGQDQPTQKSLSATMNVYVFPTTGQDAAQIENFKKAFSVCLEAKEYMVKF
jgi:hypothetical protein